MTESSALAKLKLVQEQLCLSEQRLKSSQKIARVGSWELDFSNPDDLDAGSHLYWSDQTYIIFGFKPGEIQSSNKNFFRSVHPDDRDAIRKAVHRALYTGENYDIEHRIVLPDGTVRFVHERSDIVMDPKTGKAIRMVGTVQDITEQKELRDKLFTAQKMEFLGRLSSGIAHDFNNLLFSIYGNLEFLDSHVRKTPSATRYVKSIRAAAERAADLTRRLLAFSRQQILSPSKHSLNEIVLEANEMLAPILGEKIQIQFSLAPKIGLIEVDSGQLNQIIMNLALNARDAMPDGGTLKISTSHIHIKKANRPRHDIKVGHYARMTVKDTGHGMPADVMTSIFEPFFTTKTLGKGTGLGLAIVYEIVKQSSGYILAESRVGGGSTFEILLPLAESERHTRSTSRSHLKKPTANAELSSSTSA